MSYEESLKSISLVADATIGIYTGVPGQPGSPQPHGGKQYHFVKVTGVGQAGLAAGTGDAIGVLQNKPQGVGHAATVGYSGVTNVTSGGPVTAGNAVKADGNGAGVAATLPADAAIVLGIAIGSAGAAGQLFPVLLV